MMPANEAIGLVVAIVLLLSVVAGPTMKHVAGGIVMALVLAVGGFGIYHLFDGGSAKTGATIHLGASVVGGKVTDVGDGVWNTGLRVKRGLAGLSPRRRGATQEKTKTPETTSSQLDTQNLGRRVLAGLSRLRTGTTQDATAEGAPSQADAQIPVSEDRQEAAASPVEDKPISDAQKILSLFGAPKQENFKPAASPVIRGVQKFWSLLPGVQKSPKAPAASPVPAISPAAPAPAAAVETARIVFNEKKPPAAPSSPHRRPNKAKASWFNSDSRQHA